MIKVFTLISCLCFSSYLMAQEGIQTKNELGVEDLVKKVFIKGNCKNVSNITTIGDETISIGQFDNAENIFNFDDGIILSTGAIDLAQGPNINIDESHSFDKISIDSDLDRLATDTLFDVTGIEFDFVPISNNVTFRYVFASEEYCEFVGTSFNDVFGFFVSGPGITGSFDNDAVNVAQIINLSGAIESVSINNINHLRNENFYVSNITTTDAHNCEVTHTQTFQEFIEYDGFTIALVASFQVIPCETYHIRLVIGDVGDPNLDSSVFLESNSFDIGEEISVRAEVTGSDEPIAYEGCVDGQFVFTRSSLSNINDDLTIDYNISSDSKATNGVDFLDIPLSITIPAGETSVILPITIIEDAIIEGPENLKLELEYPCDCLDPSLSELIINDPPDDLSVNFEEIAVCADQLFSISPEISGGVPPFDFIWENGIETDTLQVSVTEPTNFKIAITDFCGDTISGIANIGIQSIPTATLTGTYNFCEIVSTGIPIQFEGNPPWEIGYSIDGIEQVPIQNIQANPFYLNTPASGTYEITAFNDAYCEGLVIGSAEVESTFIVETDIVPPSCINTADGSIEVTQLEAVPPFSIEWNIETENDNLLRNLKEGTYKLSITDGAGCSYEKTFNLTTTSNDINDCAPIYIPNSFSPNNDGINDVFSIFFDADGEIESVISMQVYNRWGVLMFEQTNFLPDNGAIGWKGDFKGKPLDTGVYVYKVIIAFEDESTLLLSGDVTLFR